MRQATDDVERFAEIAMGLIAAATNYAEAGVSDPEVEGKIRKVRVVTGALQAALMNVSMIQQPPSITQPPPTPVTPVAPPPGGGVTGATGSARN
jgi:hypothetical protein